MYISENHSNHTGLLVQEHQHLVQEHSEGITKGKHLNSKNEVTQS